MYELKSFGSIKGTVSNQCKMIEVVSQHATERQYERGIKKAYLELCIGKGTRFNVKSSEGGKKWCFKYVFHGLHVVCGVEKPGAQPLVITAYWVAGNAKDVKKSIDVYDSILSQRSKKKKARQYEAKCRKVALKEQLYDDWWE